MRIVVLSKGLPAYQDVCYSELAALGNELLLIYPEDGLKFASFDKTRFSDAVQRDLWTGSMPSPRRLRRTVEDFKPDVVIMYSWHGRGYRAVIRAQRDRALRLVFTSNFWHGTAKQALGVALHRFYVDPLFDCAWVPSERSELFAKRIGFDGRSIIRGANSADTPTFDSGARTGTELMGHRRFLFVGRLIWHKAPTVLAAAYRRYRERADDPWDLDIVGAGPLAADFDGIGGVQLHGFTQPAELAQLMHRSSALILPSHIEWYGVVVHEGGSAGLPLIVSDGVGAAPHYLQDGYNGWTVAAGDVDELTTAMLRMSGASAERLGQMSDGSRALASRLSPQIWARNLHEELQRRLVDH